MKRWIIIGLILLCAIAVGIALLAPDIISQGEKLAGRSDAPETQTRMYGFQIAAMSAIRIEATNIDVRLIASDTAHNATIETYLSGQATDDDCFVVEGTILDSTTLRVRALPTREWSASEPGGGRMVVTLPRRASVAVVSGRGSLLINDVNGDKMINVADGDVAIAGGSGSFRIRAPGGNVTMEQYQGSGTIEGGSGMIRTVIVEGRIEARAEGGIQVRGHLGSVDLASRTGSIEAEILRLDSASTVATISGNIHLRIPPSLAAALSVATAPGHLDLTDAPPLLARSLIPGISIAVNEGGPPLLVESVQGWVRVKDER